MRQVLEYRDEIKIWTQLKAGNKDSFNNVFRKYYSELYHYGLKISSNPEQVKECIQEIFVRIWETREKLGDVKNIKSYLIISLRRMIISKKATNNRIEIENLENHAFRFDVNEFEKHVEISVEVRKVLLSAINSLTKKQRELIMLMFFHELTYVEISEVLEISIQAARNLTYRSLLNLREALGEASINAIRNQVYLLFSSISKKKL